MSVDVPVRVQVVKVSVSRVMVVQQVSEPTVQTCRRSSCRRSAPVSRAETSRGDRRDIVPGCGRCGLRMSVELQARMTDAGKVILHQVLEEKVGGRECHVRQRARLLSGLR